LANTYKKLSLQKFWFPVFWNEKGIGCNSRTVPATVNRNKSFCKQPLSKNGKEQNAKVRRPAGIIIKKHIAFGGKVKKYGYKKIFSTAFFILWLFSFWTRENH